jgi:hypothetical protein
MVLSIFRESRPVYARLTLVFFCELVVGVCLYALFTFMPLGVQALIVFTSWIIVSIENLTFPKNRSIASILCAITGTVCLFCGIAWRITGSEGWSRAGLVCGCLLAGLVFLDRRQEWFDL